MDDVDDVVEDFDLDLGGQLLEEQLFEDVALWQQRREAAGKQNKAGHYTQRGQSTALGLSSDSDSHQQADISLRSYSPQPATRGSSKADGPAAGDSGLPQISQLLHDNPSCASGSKSKGELVTLCTK